MALEIIKERLLLLRDGIAELEAQRRMRQVQQSEFEEMLDMRACEVQTALYALDMAPLDGNMKRRTVLEQELGLIEKERRHLRIRYGQDLFVLEKELRILRDEYRAVLAGVRCFQQKN